MQSITKFTNQLDNVFKNTANFKKLANQYRFNNYQKGQNVTPSATLVIPTHELNNCVKLVQCLDNAIKTASTTYGNIKVEAVCMILKFNNNVYSNTAIKFKVRSKVNNKLIAKFEFGVRNSPSNKFAVFTYGVSRDNVVLDVSFNEVVKSLNVDLLSLNSQKA